MPGNSTTCERSYKRAPKQRRMSKQDIVKRQVCNGCGQTALTYVDAKGVRKFQKHGRHYAMKGL